MVYARERIILCARRGIECALFGKQYIKAERAQGGMECPNYFINKRPPAAETATSDTRPQRDNGPRKSHCVVITINIFQQQTKERGPNHQALATHLTGAS
jgi:hypothetical protein